MHSMTAACLAASCLLGLAGFAAAEDAAAEPWTWERMQQFFEPPAEYAGKMGSYRSPLKFDDGNDVRTPADWPRRREEILAYWHGALGRWPEINTKPRMNVLQTEHVEGFTRQKLQIEFTAGRLAGDHYLLVPDGEGPFPAVVVVFYDGDTAAGLIKEQKYRIASFGYDLTKRGFVTLCVGASIGPRPEGMQPLSHMAYAAASAYHLLANRKDVDADRVGITGWSFGGKWAMFASCLYDKFACAAWIDPGIIWNEADANANYWEPWYLGFDPSLAKQRSPGVPSDANPRTGPYKEFVAKGRDLHELHALMAPRPFLVSGGAQDRPDHWVALNHSIAVNRFLGQERRVGMTMRDGHAPTPESNAQMYAFFEHFLKPE